MTFLPNDDHRNFEIDGGWLQRQSQLEIVFGQGRQGEGSVEAARIWQQPDDGAGKFLGLPTPSNIGSKADRRVCRLSKKGQIGWRKLSYLGFQDGRGAEIILPLELACAFRGT
ncbi:hypothetical protein GGE48_005112 [Rhizobium leguminosarum]|nr:hypothetical protein [Rhizobium leguminosarum]